MIGADDIIAAPATAWGPAAVGIIRLSGRGSAALADRIYEGRRPLSSAPPRRMELGRVRGADTVLAVRFDEGSSYTGEESVELHCHGGGAAVARCMELLTELGVRVAQPGEFTKRAYLSGRLDLAQAEAVLGVINASSSEALAASRRALQGELSERLRALLDEATRARAMLEASLDYPEEIDESEGIARAIGALADEVCRVRSYCRAGAALRSGARVAIAGPPNAGKSSLMNAIVGSARSIVTAEPGTTRDAVESQCVIDGMPITLVDTAGIREGAPDEAERIGVARAVSEAESADVLIAVIDASDAERAHGQAADLAGSEAVANKMESGMIFWALNKIDSAPGGVDLARAILPPGEHAHVHLVSALTGEGVRELMASVRDAVLDGVPITEGYAVTSRVLSALASAADLVLRAASAHDAGDDGAAGSLLASAAQELASPLGADADAEMIDEIFSKFCVGK